MIITKKAADINICGKIIVFYAVRFDKLSERNADEPQMGDP